MAATKQRASETMRRASFVVLAFCLMFASFRWNVFGIDRAAVAGNIIIVDCYVIPALDLYAGDSSLQGRVGEMQLLEDGQYHPYVMSVGLQRIAYSALAPNTREGVDRTIPYLRGLIEAILALTMTMFVVVAGKEFGYLCAVISTVMLALSNWLIVFAPDLFWVCATFFMPFVVVWLWGDPARSAKQQRMAAVLFAACCFVKCLCGYDYTTNVLGAAAVPLLYYGLRRGVPVRSIIARVARYGALSVCAFFAAFLLQIAQFKFVEKSTNGSLSAFLKEVHRRTLSNGEGLGTGYDNVVLSLLHRFHLSPSHDQLVERYLAPLRPVLRYFRYLSMGAVTVPLGKHSLQLPIGLFIVGFLVTAWFQRKPLRGALFSGGSDRLSAWTLSTVAALVITHLWIVAANGHMTHTFFNAIVFYIPFLPMVYVLLAAAIASWLKRGARAWREGIDRGATKTY
jgi:hypothetical protein